MFGDPLPDLAVRGECGIDVYERQELPGQRRARFRCLGAVLPSGAAEGYEPEGTPARLLAAAGGFAALPPLSLSDATTFPQAARDPVALFLRIDFLRAWTLADQGLARVLADPAGAFARPAQFAAQVALAYDFNRIARGAALARALLAARPAAAEEPIGFGWRMLGDLALRGGEAALALDCFQAALAVADNPHRRARAAQARARAEAAA